MVIDHDYEMGGLGLFQGTIPDIEEGNEKKMQRNYNGRGSIGVPPEHVHTIHDIKKRFCIHNSYLRSIYSR
jgi:hypothetical protein